jgi:hypothetical protein
MSNIRKFTDEERQYLKDNYTKKTVKELMKELDRPKGTIVSTASRMGITREVCYDDFIRKNYPQKTFREIAIEIKKGEKYVRRRARVMNLYKPKGKAIVKPKKIQRPPAEYTNIGGHLFLLNKYS